MAQPVALRPTTEEDRRMLFEWANDPATRASARNERPIVWEEHCGWFEKTMKSNASAIWIAMVDDEPVGQVRLDVDGSDAEIDVSVAPQHRGKGYGSSILGLLTFKHAPEGTNRLIGNVKKSNAASRGAFLKAGFDEERLSGGHEMVTFVKKISNG